METITTTTTNVVLSSDIPVWSSVVSMILVIMTFVFGVVINIVLILVIVQKKHLKTYMNVYFINLSVGDMIICCVILPMRAGMFVYHRNLHHSVYRVDLFFQTLTDLVRMFLLIGVSFERHQAIVAPFNKGPSGKWRTFAGCLASWVISFILALVCALLYENSLDYVFTAKSLTRDEETEIYFILPISSLCLIIIFVCYIAMLRHLHNHGNKMQKLKRKKAKVSPEITTISKDVEKTQNSSEKSKTKTDTTTLAVLDISDRPNSSIGVSSVPNKADLSKSTVITDVSICDMDGTVRKGNLMLGGEAKEIVGAVCVYNPKNRAQGKRRVEMRAAKRIAGVMGIFLSLWLPYPIGSIICKSFLEGESDCRSALAVLACISCLTAVTNPLFYLLTNKQLKSAARSFLSNTFKWKIK